MKRAKRQPSFQAFLLPNVCLSLLPIRYDIKPIEIVASLYPCDSAIGIYSVYSEFVPEINVCRAGLYFITEIV